MEDPQIFIDLYISEGALITLVIITAVTSLALAFFAIRRLKNSGIFVGLAAACAVICYPIFLEFYDAQGAGIIMVGLLPGHITPILVLAGIALLGICKDRGILTKMTRFVLIVFLVWSLAYNYSAAKSQEDIEDFNNYVKSILTANVWIAVGLISFACFLMTIGTRMMTRGAIGAYLSLAVINAILWTIYLHDHVKQHPPKLDTILQGALALNAILPGIVLYALMMIIRENPDESDTLL